MGPRRWQDWCNLVVGLWLFLTPLLFNYDPAVPAARVNALVFGALIVALSTAAITVPKAWEEWVNLAIGLWMIVAPNVLGFIDYNDESRTASIVGLWVTALAVWALVRDIAVQKWWHDHHFHWRH